MRFNVFRIATGTALAEVEHVLEQSIAGALLLDLTRIVGIAPEKQNSDEPAAHAVAYAQVRLMSTSHNSCARRSS